MEWLYFISGLLLLILLCLRIHSPTEVVQTDFSSNALKKATVYYYLPETILKIQATAKVVVIYNAENKLTDSNQIIETHFVIKPEMIGDTSELLALNYKPNIFMSDVIKYAVNAKGLLETVNVTTEDRTTEIISKLPITLNEATKSSSFTNLTETTIVKIKEYSSDFEIKVSEIPHLSKPIGWNIVVYNELGIDELPKILNASFNISSEDIPKTSPSLSAIINKDSNSNAPINGILTRPLKNISIKIDFKGDTNNSNFCLASNVMVADVTKLIVVPVNRTDFVKRINNIGIQNGVILNHEITKPSSVEGFFAIPINIAKAILSIPAQIFQFKFDNTKKSDELEKLQQGFEKFLQESQKNTLTKSQDTKK